MHQPHPRLLRVPLLLLILLTLAGCTSPLASLREQMDFPVAAESVPAETSSAPTAAPTEPIATDAEPADIQATPDATATISATLSVTEVPTSLVPVRNEGSSVEVKPQVIPLTGALTSRNAEVSSMAWMSDTLVIMPQYTDFAGDGRDVWYTLSKAEILAWVRGEVEGALTPGTLPIVTNDLPDRIPGYEGFEAIAFDGQGNVYLTSEATANWVTAAWLIHGEVADDGASVTLDPAPTTWIEPQSLTLNHSDESLVLTPDDGMFTLYEVNGAQVNTEPTPLAHVFGRNLAARGAIAFPTIAYRITDATSLDAENRFWAINYFFPSDVELAVESDPIAEEYGEGDTHANSPQVERLLEFVWLGDRIERTETAPIQLQLSLISRNWEGIVRLEDGGRQIGFLIITDQFPDTILAFVPYQTPTTE